MFVLARCIELSPLTWHVPTPWWCGCMEAGLEARRGNGRRARAADSLRLSACFLLGPGDRQPRPGTASRTSRPDRLDRFDRRDRLDRLGPRTPWDQAQPPVESVPFNPTLSVQHPCVLASSSTIVVFLFQRCIAIILIQPCCRKAFVWQSADSRGFSRCSPRLEVAQGSGWLSHLEAFLFAGFDSSENATIAFSAPVISRLSMSFCVAPPTWLRA